MPQSKWILEQVVLGDVVYLCEGITTIGRNSRSTIVLSCSHVSRNHAQIRISPDSNDIRITDLGSKNGIYINDFHYSNTERALHVGDRIGIGVAMDGTTASRLEQDKYPIYQLKRLYKQKIKDSAEGIPKRQKR